MLNAVLHRRFITLAASTLMVGFIVTVGVACSDTEPTPTPQAAVISTLIPPTPTLTPTLTQTPPIFTPALRPNDLPTYTPAIISILPESATVAVDHAMRDLRQQLDLLDDAVIGVLNLRRVNWPDGKLGCAPRVVSSALRGESGVGGYRVALNYGGDGYVYHTDTEGTVYFCTQAELLSVEGEPLAFDPIGESLIDPAESDLVRRLAVDGGAVEWVDLSAMTWIDSSLGCPRPNLNYTVVNIPGYRIVFRVPVEEGDETTITTHIYHSDGLQVNYCDADFEVLPPPYGTVEAVIIGTPVVEE